MKLYHLELAWDEYDDRGDAYLGAFSSEKLRDDAENHIHATADRVCYPWVYLDQLDTRFKRWETELDSYIKYGDR